MADVCGNTTTPSYARQRAAYAKQLGHNSIKDLVKEQLLENWQDGHCSDDSVFELGDLKKENITLSDVAAAMSDIFDAGVYKLNFTYNGATDLWGNGGLVEKLKDAHGGNCDVREMDEIDLSKIIGGSNCDVDEETPQNQTYGFNGGNLTRNQLKTLVLENPDVLSDLVESTQTNGSMGFQFDNEAKHVGVASKELTDIVTKHNRGNYTFNAADIFNLGKLFDAVAPNLDVHSQAKNEDGWMGTGEVQGVLDALVEKDMQNLLQQDAFISSLTEMKKKKGGLTEEHIQEVLNQSDVKPLLRKLAGDMKTPETASGLVFNYIKNLNPKDGFLGEFNYWHITSSDINILVETR